MNPRKYEQTKRKIIETACSSIENAQAFGKQERARIDTLKTAAIQQIEVESQDAQVQDDARSQQRTELIRLLSEAAQSGNFTEMRRIKQLLDNDI